jgi:hypothetical protein
MTVSFFLLYPFGTREKSETALFRHSRFLPTPQNRGVAQALKGHFGMVFEQAVTVNQINITRDFRG